AVAELDLDRRQAGPVAGAAAAGAGEWIESRAVGLALDLAAAEEEPPVADVDREGAVGTAVHPGTDLGAHADRESFGAPGGKREPDRIALLKLGEHEELHVEGFQGISRPPARKLAARAMVNSRSDRRFRYDRTSGSAPSVTQARSARRQTVRQKCSAAPAREPPGRMKLRISGSSAVSRSISRSRRAT